MYRFKVTLQRLLSRPRLSALLMSATLVSALVAPLAGCDAQEDEASLANARVASGARPLTPLQSLDSKSDFSFELQTNANQRAERDTTEATTTEGSLSELLWSVYELYTEEMEAHRARDHAIDEPPTDERPAEAPPAEDCLNCGRETGFLPPPEPFLESVTPLESKDTSYVTFTWDEVEGGNSYRVFLLQVDEALGLLSASSSADVHIPEVGLGLTHGFSYVIFALTYHSETKAHSLPSAPIFMRCSLSYGCFELSSDPSEL